jgi:hypothetical protein
MFNPAALRIKVGNDIVGERGFVGVRRDSSGDLQFCVPYGFTEYPFENPYEVNKLFFDIYKVFRTFSERKIKDQTKTVRENRDGVVIGERGFSFTDDEDEVVTIYSKIPMLEAILDAYDDLKIFLLTACATKSEPVNYSRLDRYLDKAIFLDGDVAFVDAMVIPKEVLGVDITDIVRMYCFIYVEIKHAMGDEHLTHTEVRAQAQIFKGQHLSGDSGLFQVQSHDRTIELLKEKLAEFERQIGWKDADFWQFFDVIQIFLYGDRAYDGEGEYWGVNSFSLVWEDMCLSWVFANCYEDILFADSEHHANNNVGRFPVYMAEHFHNTFYICHNGKKRYLKPDIVRHIKPHPEADLIKETFDISWKPSQRTCTVKLRRRDKFGRQKFNELASLLHVNGMRRPSASTEFFTFHLVSKEQYDHAIQVMAQKLRGRNNLTEHILIADCKYVGRETYTSDNLNWKASEDIQKQIVYEIAIESSGIASEIRSQFCIPRYFVKPIKELRSAGIPVPMQDLNSQVRTLGIEILEVDFYRVFSAYVAETPVA